MAYYFPTLGLEDVSVKWGEISFKNTKIEEKDVQTDTRLVAHYGTHHSALNEILH